MIVPMSIAARTKISGRTFGRMWRMRMRGDEADEKGDLAAVEETHHLAAADLVGAEHVCRWIERRLRVDAQEILLLEGRVEHVLREERRRDRRGCEQQQQGRRSHREAIAT